MIWPTPRPINQTPKRRTWPFLSYHWLSTTEQEGERPPSKAPMKTRETCSVALLVTPAVAAVVIPQRTMFRDSHFAAGNLFKA